MCSYEVGKAFCIISVAICGHSFFSLLNLDRRHLDFMRFYFGVPVFKAPTMVLEVFNSTQEFLVVGISFRLEVVARAMWLGPMSLVAKANIDFAYANIAAEPKSQILLAMSGNV